MFYRISVIKILTAAMLMSAAAHSAFAHASCCTDSLKTADSPHTALSQINIETQTAAQPLPATDTLLLLKNMRAPIHKQPPSDSTLLFNPFYSGSSEIFRSDGVSASEILRYNAFGVYVPFTLSGSMNRILPFGNTAPFGDLSPASAPALKSSRFDGSDRTFSTLGSDFYFSPSAQFSYQPHPHRLAVPETVIFWENGVFDQNTFNLRFSRPLSPNLMLSAFSNYRNFKGKRFSHSNTGTLDFYHAIASDTTLIMDRGYNPLVDELSMGGAILLLNDDNSELRAGFSYENFANEYALDTSAQTMDRLHWALLEREIYRTDISLVNKKIGPLNANFKAALGSESYNSSFQPDTTYATGKANRLSVTGGADVGINLGKLSRAAFTLESAVSTHEFFDGREELFIENTPQLVYSLKLPLGAVNSEFDVSGGAIMLSFDDSTRAAPKAKASAKFFTDNARLTLFAKADGITVYPDYDYFLFSPYCDDYVMFGGDIFLRASYGGVLLGYQFVDGIEAATVNMAWPMGKAPYPQASHTIIIAPGTSRIKGFSLLSRAMISDSKPYVKASANLSYVIQPRGMLHFFEAALGMDYWSEREPVLFANINDYGWNRPIYDLNLKIAAHIRSFRLFYKMDNMLNLRQAYVPGYFSPGITFRWGVNWFIQR